jgi:hypothetical protein
MDPKLIRLYDLEKCIHETADDLEVDVSRCVDILRKSSASSEYKELLDYATSLGKRIVKYFEGNIETTHEVEYDGYSLDLSNKNINFIYEYSFPLGIMKLNISNNHISSLKWLPKTLTELWIFGNQVKTLTTSKGEALLPPNLIDLDISGNNIKSLKGLPSSLKVLWCGDNRISSLEWLPADLVELNIYNNRIKSAKGLVKKTRNLRNLNIMHNNLTSLEGIPPGLTELDVSGNKIKSLKGVPRNLVKLNISHNNVASIEGLPTSLVELNVLYNDIKIIPNEIVQLKKLRVFKFDGNRFILNDLSPSVQNFLRYLGKSQRDSESDSESESDFRSESEFESESESGASEYSGPELREENFNKKKIIKSYVYNSNSCYLDSVLSFIINFNNGDNWWIDKIKNYSGRDEYTLRLRSVILEDVEKHALTKSSLEDEDESDFEDEDIVCSNIRKLVYEKIKDIKSSKGWVQYPAETFYSFLSEHFDFEIETKDGVRHSYFLFQVFEDLENGSGLLKKLKGKPKILVVYNTLLNENVPFHIDVSDDARYNLIGSVNIHGADIEKYDSGGHFTLVYKDTSNGKALFYNDLVGKIVETELSFEDYISRGDDKVGDKLLLFYVL